MLSHSLHCTAATPQKRSGTNRDASGSGLLFRVTLSAVARRRLQRGMREMARHPKDLLRHGLIELKPPTAGRSVLRVQLLEEHLLSFEVIICLTRILFNDLLSAPAACSTARRTLAFCFKFVNIRFSVELVECLSWKSDSGTRSWCKMTSTSSHVSEGCKCGLYRICPHAISVCSNKRLLS
jgi:hypothetical protein